jgi:hypothetical protein
VNLLARTLVTVLLVMAATPSTARGSDLVDSLPLPLVDYAQATEKIERSWNTVLGIRNLYTEKAYDEAFRIALSAYNSDSPHIAYWLGRMYFEGRGVEKNGIEARRFLRIADREGLGFASQLLAQLYSSSGLVEKNLELARAYHARWIQYEAARSDFYSREVPVLGTILSSDARSTVRYWTRRATYYRNLYGYIQRNKLRAELFEPTPQVGPTKPIRLDATCRPAAPPTRVMSQLKLEEVKGNIFFFVDGHGKPDGMVVDGIGHPKLVTATLSIFDDALNSGECVFGAEHRHELVQLPFVFKLE